MIIRFPGRRFWSIETEVRHILDSLEPLDDEPKGTALDDATVESEALFIRRFGFDWPRFHRMLLLRLKQQRDLTDREIRTLYRNSTLRRLPGAVSLQARRWFPWVGYFTILAMFLPIAQLFVAIIICHPQSLKLLTAVGFFGFSYLCISIAAWMFYVAPWRVWCRNEAEFRARLRTAPTS